MQIIKYEVNRNILTVGFKEDNFVVYSQIAFDSAKTKRELLQKAYVQCKGAIDYEKTQTEHSFTTEVEGEEFIPEQSKATIVKLNSDKNHIQFALNQENEIVNLSVEIKDQYGDDFAGSIAFVTDYGAINNNVLTIPKVTENEVITITANIGDIWDTIKINVYPYTEPKIVNEVVDDETIAIAELIIDFDTRLKILENK